MAQKNVSLLGRQIGKFTVVGIMNTVIDVVVLNFLVLVLLFKTQIYIFGFPFLVANFISVTLAMINSYFWNKYWTFEGGEKKDRLYEVIKFFFITVIGIYVINQIVFNLLNTYWLWPTHLVLNIFHAVGIIGLNNFISLNFAKLFAILASLVWNFIFYKIWVFKK
jgi:putative flippase GtrA